MGLITKERVYGLDLYSFSSSKNTPYQLTFDTNQQEEHVVVCLVNLLGSNKNLYCSELRHTISIILYNYLETSNKKLYFDLLIKDKPSVLLFNKFIRWMSLDDGLKHDIDITPYEDNHHVGVTLSAI